MRPYLFILLSLALLTGCATSSIESRKKEKADAYAVLSPQQRADVEQGRLRVGMPPDAVYISWGKPAQILESETDQGHMVTWLYESGWMQEQRYWAYRQVGSRGRDACVERYLVRDYYPRAYVSAEIVFVDGVVNRWRTLPRPVY